MQAMLQAFCALCVLGLVTLSRGNTTPVAELDECSSLQVAGPSTHAALAMEGSRLNGSVNFSLSNSPCAPVRFVGVSGLLLTAKACWASEAMELLSSLLARMKLLEQSQECIHCDDLVEISRQLPFPDVTKRNDFLKQLHDKGIFKAVQMQSLKSKDLGDLSGNPLLLNKLQAEMSMQAAGTKKNKARNEAIKRRKDAMEDTEEGLADLERLLNTELSDAQTSSNDLRRQVQEDMARARQALNQVELESADLDTSDERNQLDAAITSGGFVNGQQLPLSTLISYAGVMRGVRLASFGSVNPIGLAQVVQFTPEMQAMSEEELRSTVAVHPAQSSLEVSLETERAGDFVSWLRKGNLNLEDAVMSLPGTRL
ncbi:unnamed protein product [Symbiodinium sp. CCMP2592]|nr:unnamed protein product [Symbiodinium sp. CCMP2592]